MLSAIDPELTGQADEKPLLVTQSPAFSVADAKRRVGGKCGVRIKGVGVNKD
jgi:hypothetical protein